MQAKISVDAEKQMHFTMENTNENGVQQPRTEAERQAQEQMKAAQQQAAQVQAAAKQQAEGMEKEMKKKVVKGMVLGTLTAIGTKLLSSIFGKISK